MTQSITSILPTPFEWIDIPGGTVKLEKWMDTLEGTWMDLPDGTIKIEVETYTIDGFAISKYPITNAQFQVFVDATDGYSRSRWWDFSGNALDWRLEDEYSQKSTFEGADHPRTNVAWYEAVAFCRWLSVKTGQKIMLPTEQQWQRTAQGNDERVYPWGEHWDGSKCNNSVDPFSSKSTSPVNQYEGKGDSPFGVVDMVGNVWEWCLTDYETGNNELGEDAISYVLRGGSWLNTEKSAYSCNYRKDAVPDDGYYNEGFRICRS